MAAYDDPGLVILHCRHCREPIAKIRRRHLVSLDESLQVSGDELCIACPECQRKTLWRPPPKERHLTE